MFIEIDYNLVKVPDEIIAWCDVMTVDAERDDLRYMDCIYMNMGEYGNEMHELKKMREQLRKELRVVPVFKQFSTSSAYVVEKPVDN